MTRVQATAEVFVAAFRALPRRQKDAVLSQLAKDRTVREDLIDLAVAEERKKEPSRPLREFLLKVHRKKNQR